MGFTSIDDLINQMTVNGKKDFVTYQKTISALQVAGTWCDLAAYAGLPVAHSYAGTSLTWVDLDDTSTGAIPTGGDVSTATKHFISAIASIVASAGAPWLLMAVDNVGYVPITGTDVTGTSARTVTMTALGSGHRYPYGAGLRAYFMTEVAPTAGGPNLTAFSYTNTAGTTGRTCPVTVSMYATPVAGAIPHSGAAANRYGPFIPLAAGDTGIRDIESFTLSGGTAYTGSGTLSLRLAKPLWAIPITASGATTVMDFVNSLPSLPQIKDDAFLTFLLFNTGATPASTPCTFAFDYAYGG